MTINIRRRHCSAHSARYNVQRAGYSNAWGIARNRLLEARCLPSNQLGPGDWVYSLAVPINDRFDHSGSRGRPALELRFPLLASPLSWLDRRPVIHLVCFRTVSSAATVVQPFEVLRAVKLGFAEPLVDFVVHDAKPDGGGGSR